MRGPPLALQTAACSFVTDAALRVETLPDVSARCYMKLMGSERRLMLASRILGLAVVVGLLALGRAPSAMELVEGGYGLAATHSGASELAPLGDPWADGSEFGQLAIEFTPRHAGGGVLLGETAAGGVSFRLDVAGSLDEGLEGTLLEDAAGSPAPSSGRLSIGGAIQLEDWSFGGGYLRTSLVGDEADLMSALVGYGPVTARLSYGQAWREEKALDILMLSTDLAAWSWLTLESDLALGSDQATDSMAVGRVGLRLSF